mmetsp:Transcript_30202/g.80564  ORF Transcript_30202/g.80564 Transcript_30202/m.80564 type:complete len:210 (-) Transcript_30202:181-810(-)
MSKDEVRNCFRYLTDVEVARVGSGNDAGHHFYQFRQCPWHAYHDERGGPAQPLRCQTSGFRQQVGAKEETLVLRRNSRNEVNASFNLRNQSGTCEIQLRDFISQEVPNCDSYDLFLARCVDSPRFRNHTFLEVGPKWGHPPQLCTGNSLHSASSSQLSLRTVQTTIQLCNVAAVRDPSGGQQDAVDHVPLRFHDGSERLLLQARTGRRL